MIGGANVTNIYVTLRPLSQNPTNMTFKKTDAGQKNYVSPAIEALDLQCEQAIMATSGGDLYGLPGEDPFVNDFGEF